MSELRASLQAMGIVQFALAFSFLISYPLALSRFAGPRGRRCAVLGAFASACGFAAATDPWLNGVLMLALAVVGVGLFIVIAWTTSALLALGQRRAAPSRRPALDAALNQRSKRWRRALAWPVHWDDGRR